MHTMTTAQTLLAYSEWLDGDKHLIRTEHAPAELADEQTHEDLVNGFIEYWESNPNRALLAGDLPEESDDREDKVDRRAGTAPSTKEAVKALTKLARTSKKEDIRLQAAQTLLNYDHVVRS